MDEKVELTGMMAAQIGRLMLQLRRQGKTVPPKEKWERHIEYRDRLAALLAKEKE